MRVVGPNIRGDHGRPPSPRFTLAATDVVVGVFTHIFFVAIRMR